MATRQKQVLVMPQEDRLRMLEGLYAGCDEKLRTKVRFDDERFHFAVKGVGAKVSQVRPSTSFLGCNLNSEALAILRQPGYDMDHLLIPDHVYQMVLCYGDEFTYDVDRTATNIRDLVRSEYGDRVSILPPAELAFLVRGMFTYHEMQKLGLDYMAVLHADIAGDVQSNQLLSRTNKGDPWMKGWITGPDAAWPTRGGFVFPLVD